MTWFLEVFGALGHAKSEEPGCLPNPPLMTCLWGGTGVLLLLLSRPECFHWLSSSCMPGTCSNAWRAVLTSSLDMDESWGPETLITYPVTPTSQLWVDETGVKAPRPVKSKLHGNPVIFPKIVKEDGASSLEKNIKRDIWMHACNNQTWCLHRTYEVYVTPNDLTFVLCALQDFEL